MYAASYASTRACSSARACASTARCRTARSCRTSATEVTLPNRASTSVPPTRADQALEVHSVWANTQEAHPPAARQHTAQKTEEEVGWSWARASHHDAAPASTPVRAAHHHGHPRVPPRAATKARRAADIATVPTVPTYEKPGASGRPWPAAWLS